MKKREREKKREKKGERSEGKKFWKRNKQRKKIRKKKESVKKKIYIKQKNTKIKGIAANVNNYLCKIDYKTLKWRICISINRSLIQVEIFWEWEIIPYGNKPLLKLRSICLLMEEIIMAK